MALYAHFTTQVIGIGTGQTSITCTDERTGKVFTPKLILTMWNKRAAVGTAEDNLNWGYGAAISPSVQRATSSFSGHALPDSSAAGGGVTNAMVRILANSSTFSGQVVLDAMTATGFTYTPSSFTSDRLIGFLSLGGDIQVTITDIDSLAAPGNLDADLGMDLATGRDDKALIIFGYSSSGGAVGSVRSWNDRQEISVVAGDTISQWAIGQSAVSGAADSHTSRYMRADEALCWCQGSTSNKHATATQWNSNGVRFNFSESADVNTHWFVVAIKGQNWKCGTLNTRTDTTPIYTETGMQPGLLLLAGFHKAQSTFDTVDDHDKGCVGFALSDTTQACMSHVDVHGLPDTSIGVGFHTDRVYNQLDHVGTDQSLVVGTATAAFGGRGFHLTMGTADPTAGLTGFLVGADDPAGYRDLRISGRNYLNF